jgi:hypothetical protein
MIRRLLPLCIVFAASSARAENVGVVVTGDATLQPALASQLEGWLRNHGHKLALAPLPPDAINQIIDCFVLEDEPCARKTIEQRATSKAVVYLRVDIQPGTGSEHTVTLLAYWFQKGHAGIAERRFCEHCNDATLRSTADEMMKALASAGQKDVGHLKLTTKPAGAHVHIDGLAIGLTPLDYDLSLGPHKIEVSRAGRETERREVAIRHGETSVVDVSLVESPSSGGSSKVLPIAVMSAGGALFVTGVIMFAIDQDPGPDQGFEIRNTAPTGVGLGIAGIAVGVGGYLWYRSVGKHESAPVAAITRDGAYVGWLGRF